MPSVREVLAIKGSDVCTIEQDASVLDAATKMNQRHIGALMVMNGEKIAGIFTERDVLNRVVAENKDPSTTLVQDVMTAKVKCCSPDTPLESCRTAMTNNKIRHIPVVDGGRLVGLISSGDILARELKDQAETIRYLHEYMQGPN